MRVHVNRRGVTSLFAAFGLAGAAALGLATLATAQQSTVKQVESAKDLPSGRYGLEIDVRPQASSADVYLCTVTLTDLATGRVLSAPQMRFRRGSSATFRSGVQNPNQFVEGKAATTSSAGTDQVVATIAVSGDGVTATIDVRVLRDGKPILSQKASIRLA